MSHPPICPKSEMFFVEDSGETYMQFPDETSDFAWACNIAFSNGYERRVAAAFAEVEFRKRAERWDKVLDRAFKRFDWENLGDWTKHAPTKFPHTQKFRCLEIADQWRAWGSSK